MSIQAVAWVLEHSEATLADRLVLLAIANHCDARGWNGYPSVPLIAREARLGRSTVYRSIEALEASGELTVQRRTSKPSIYGIPALMGSQNGTAGGSQVETQGVPDRQKRGPRMTPEPSRTVHEPAAVVGFPERCPLCGHFKFDCQCNQLVDKERAKEWIRAIKRGEQPA